MTRAADTLQQTDAIRTGGTNQAPRPPRVPLGMELPVFCERCGYSLNALPQVRCDHCSLLQFHCPECGHHQPINTLRPAVQRTIGRLRALLIGLLAFVKLNWFGWHTFFWVMMGYEWAYTYDFRSGNSAPLGLTLEAGIAFGIYAFIVSFISRLLLLRWRSGALVGVVLAAVLCMALMIGFEWRVSNNAQFGIAHTREVITPGRLVMMLYTFLVVVGAAAAAWPLWTGFVRVTMPERAGNALLEWQRSLADPAPTPPARLSDQP